MVARPVIGIVIGLIVVFLLWEPAGPRRPRRRVGPKPVADASASSSPAPSAAVDETTAAAVPVPEGSVNGSSATAAASIAVTAASPTDPPPSTADPTPAPRGPGTRKRPKTDLDYHSTDFDGAYPVADERVAPPSREYTSPYVRPGKPPVDAVLLFPFASAEWEKDYLPRDLLPTAMNGGRLAVRAISVDKWMGSNPEPPIGSLTRGALFNDTSEAAASTPPIIWAAHLSDSFPPNCPKRVLAKLRYYQPTVALVLSDEHARTWCLHSAIEMHRRSEGGVHAIHPRLVLRQYSKKSSGNIPGRDVATMPLGYMSGMTLPPNLERDVLRISSKRRLQWAFIGNQKGARKTMIDIVASRLKPYVATSKGGFTPLVMTRVYGDAKFVLSPKGFSRLDCFRLYEASRVGAIPVVVARQAEAHVAFDTFVGERKGTLPPWVFANNWPEATKMMRKLVDDPAALDARQREVLDWWDRVNFHMRQAIYDAVAAATTPTTTNA